jgi:flagellin-like protein
MRKAMDDDAVSPVIGVILMVAITVVLAAVIFVIVSGMGNKSQQSAPTPVLQVDDINDRLSVVSASIGADWTRVKVTATLCTTGGIVNIGSSSATHQNMPATIAATYAAISNSGCSGLNPAIQVASATATINAGDYLAFCTSGGTATNVKIQLMDTIANTVLGDYTFTTLKAC